MTIYFKNQALKYSLSDNLTGRLDTIFTDLLEECGLSAGEVTIVIADNAFLQRLNREYRDKDAPTDVLSFSFLEEDNYNKNDDSEFPVGDIYISIDMAEKQATEADHSLDLELIHLAIHGFLHLIGYDHDRAENAKIMEEKEEVLLALFRQDHPEGI